MYSKTILLSIDEAYFLKQGFPTPAKAKLGANKMWKMFGSLSFNFLTLRPFELVVVDDFDLDFEATINNNMSFANPLRTLMDANQVQSKKV